MGFKLSTTIIRTKMESMKNKIKTDENLLHGKTENKKRWQNNIIIIKIILNNLILQIKRPID